MLYCVCRWNSVWAFLEAWGNDLYPSYRLIRSLSTDIPCRRSPHKFKILRWETQNLMFAAYFYEFRAEILPRDSKRICLGVQAGTEKKKILNAYFGRFQGWIFFETAILFRPRHFFGGCQLDPFAYELGQPKKRIKLSRVEARQPLQVRTWKLEALTVA